MNEKMKQQHMKTLTAKLVGVVLILLPLVFIENTAADQPQENFSSHVVIEYNDKHLDLSLTGLTIRRKLFLKIYSMAHYIELSPGMINPGVSDNEIYQTILQNNVAKQVSMVFLRSLKASQIKDSLLSGIKTNSSEDEYQQILPDVEKFQQAISSDVEKDDEFVIRWLPDGTLVSLFQGKEISAIRNDRFARVLWSIWFSEKSVVNRKSLIEKLLTSS